MLYAEVEMKEFIVILAALCFGAYIGLSINLANFIGSGIKSSMTHQVGETVSVGNCVGIITYKDANYYKISQAICKGFTQYVELRVKESDITGVIK